MQVAASPRTIVLRRPAPRHPDLTTGTDAMHIRMLLGDAVAALQTLFEGVFGDDIEAGTRIAPLVGYDLF